MSNLLNPRNNLEILLIFGTLFLQCLQVLCSGSGEPEAGVSRLQKRQTRKESLITYRLPNGDFANVEAFREFEDEKEFVSILDGRKAQIYCNLSWPGPNQGLRVRWFKDDELYVGDKDRNVHIVTNSTMTLINIPKVEVDKDVGKYMCAITDVSGVDVASFEYKVVKYDYPIFWTWLALAVAVIIIIVIVGALCFICKNRMRK